MQTVRTLSNWFVLSREISSWGLVPTSFCRKECLVLILEAENIVIILRKKHYIFLYLYTRMDTSTENWRQCWQERTPPSPWQCLCSSFCIPWWSEDQCPSLCRGRASSRTGRGGGTFQSSPLEHGIPRRWRFWQVLEIRTAPLLISWTQWNSVVG